MLSKMSSIKVKKADHLGLALLSQPATKKKEKEKKKKKCTYSLQRLSIFEEFNTWAVNKEQMDHNNL